MTFGLRAGCVGEKMKIKLTTLKCHRCGYEWIPKSTQMPKRCPSRPNGCGSRYWAKPVERHNVSAVQKKRVNLKNLNALLKPHGLEMIKGKGYFYFMELEGCSLKNIPKSIYCNSMNQGTWEQWEQDIKEAIKQSKMEI